MDSATASSNVQAMSDPNSTVPGDMVDWSSLPKPVLHTLLSCVPLQHRLSCCALVCSSWAEEATAVTDSIVLPHSKWNLKREFGGPGSFHAEKESKTVAGLQLWLQKHGYKLKQLRVATVDGADIDWLQLSCPKLQCLELQAQYFACSLGLGSQVCSGIAAATGLTRLVLHGIVLPVREVWDQLLAAVTSLKGLQQLKLGDMNWRVRGMLRPPQPAAQFLQQLQQLPQLTHLQLGCSPTDGVLGHLGGFTRLKSLEVNPDYYVKHMPALQQMQGLTQLALWDVAGSVDSFAPGLKQLTGLRRLQLRGGGETGSFATVSASDIAGITGLQRLVLCRLKQAASADPSSLPGEQLLPVVGKLQHLTELVLKECLGFEHCSAQAFLALTASSKLERLCLNITDLGHLEMSVWQHVFAASSVRPHLTTLRLTDVQPKLQAVDLQHLVQCCPALKVLVLEHAVQADVQLTMLQQLSALRELRLSGDVPQSTANVVARLTGLQHLALSADVYLKKGSMSEIKDADVLQLTALKQLTLLDLSGCGVSRDLQEELIQLSLFAPIGEDGADFYCQAGRCRGFYNKVSEDMWRICSC